MNHASHSSLQRLEKGLGTRNLLQRLEKSIERWTISLRIIICFKSHGAELIEYRSTFRFCFNFKFEKHSIYVPRRQGDRGSKERSYDQLPVPQESGDWKYVFSVCRLSSSEFSPPESSASEMPNFVLEMAKNRGQSFGKAGKFRRPKARKICRSWSATIPWHSIARFWLDIDN